VDGAATTMVYSGLGGLLFRERMALCALAAGIFQSASGEHHISQETEEPPMTDRDTNVVCLLLVMCRFSAAEQERQWVTSERRPTTCSAGESRCVMTDTTTCFRRTWHLKPHQAIPRPRDPRYRIDKIIDFNNTFSRQARTDKNPHEDHVFSCRLEP
jgi:hypothetical protein